MAADDDYDEAGGGPTGQHVAVRLALDPAPVEDDALIFVEAESVFAEFVRNANALGHDPRTVRAALQRVAEATVAEAAPLPLPAALPIVAALESFASEYDVEEVDGGSQPGARVHVKPGKRAADPTASAETRVTPQQRPLLAAVAATVVAPSPQRAPMPARWDDAETAKETGPGGVPVVLLTKRRTLPPDTVSPLASSPLAPSPLAPSSLASSPLASVEAIDTDVRAPAPGEEMYVPSSPRGLTTQRREARAVVPEVASIAPQARPLPERGEDGEVPPRELERLLADMSALRRWGHEAQVRDELDKLRRRYPSDLLLMRRIAEFHLEGGQNDAAMDVLFALSGRLFERRNVEGMRAALEQVLVLDPGNARAGKLLSLLVKRDSAPP